MVDDVRVSTDIDVCRFIAERCKEQRLVKMDKIGLLFFSPIRFPFVESVEYLQEERLNLNRITRNMTQLATAHRFFVRSLEKTGRLSQVSLLALNILK